MNYNPVPRGDVGHPIFEKLGDIDQEDAPTGTPAKGARRVMLAAINVLLFLIGLVSLLFLFLITML